MESDDQNLKVVQRFQEVARRWSEMDAQWLRDRCGSTQEPVWMFRGENKKQEAMLLACMPVSEIPGALKALLDTAPATIHAELQQAIVSWSMEQAAALLATMCPEERERSMKAGREIGLAMMDQVSAKASGSRPQ